MTNGRGIGPPRAPQRVSLHSWRCGAKPFSDVSPAHPLTAPLGSERGMKLGGCWPLGSNKEWLEASWKSQQGRKGKSFVLLFFFSLLKTLPAALSCAFRAKTSTNLFLLVFLFNRVVIPGSYSGVWVNAAAPTRPCCGNAALHRPKAEPQHIPAMGKPKRRH